MWHAGAFWRAHSNQDPRPCPRERTRTGHAKHEHLLYLYINGEDWRDYFVRVVIEKVLKARALLPIRMARKYYGPVPCSEWVRNVAGLAAPF
jgi:hypothetical protein